jgi:predicted RNA-binding Zn-ribbon protein involved in translation (DUF1610 family)
MSQRRCPNCGGLVGRDAAWCGQCLHRLDRADDAGSVGGVKAPPLSSPPEAEKHLPAPEIRPGSSAVGGGRGFGIRAQGVVWTCPTCGTANDLEVASCQACGTPFGTLFREAAPRTEVKPERAIRLSLLFPGLGHVVAGSVAEGVARAVVFAYALATGVSVLVARSGLGLGPFLPLMLLGFASAGILYVVTAMDAGRAARGDPPVLSTRMLLYGATTLMLITVSVLVIAGVRASPPG